MVKSQYRTLGNFHVAKFLRILRIEAQSQKFPSQKFCRQLVGAVIVGRGILLSLPTSSYGCECVWCLSDGSFKVF